jgi:hypothetical protein
MKPIDDLLAGIARKHLLIETLEERHSDSLDFHDVNVVGVKDALLAAYRAGAEAARACIATAGATPVGDLPDPSGIDVHVLLAPRRQIADVWSIEDVQEVRPDLTDDQAWEVLRRAEDNFDAEAGINWDILSYHAQMLFGDAPDADESDEG